MTDFQDDEGGDGAGGDWSPPPDSAADEGAPSASAPGSDRASTDPDERGDGERAAAGESGGEDGDRSAEDARSAAALAEEVDAAVATGEDVGEPKELDGRVRYLWIVGSATGAAMLGIAVTVAAYFFFEEYLWAGGAAFAALVLLGIARAVLLYRSWHYVVREDSLYLHRGVLTRVQTLVPYVRVQHIDTRRSPLERAVGLSTLVVYTAGSRGADVTIPGLEPDRAADLQARLKRLAIESEEEDAV